MIPAQTRPAVPITYERDWHRIAAIAVGVLAAAVTALFALGVAVIL